jgi:hypothetical protein
MRALSFAVALIFLLQPVAGQADGFLRLGEDPGGDQSTIPDTIFDILYIDASTDGENLLFDLGLAGTTSEVATVCPVVAFQVGGSEYLAFDCFECAAYECTNAASTVNPPGSSRGAKVGTVTFTETTARMVVPFAEINVAMGDVIDDIYGLTYATRVLNVQDAAPDAKTSAGADESFGSYMIGVGRPTLLGDVLETVTTTYEDLDAPMVSHSFTNATTENYVFNFTSASGFGLVEFDINGTGNVTGIMTDGNVTELFNGTLMAGTTEYQNFTSGFWSLQLSYENFTGSLDFSFLDGATSQAEVPLENNATAGMGNETTLDALEDGQEAPGMHLAFVMALLGAVAMAIRRRS